MDYNEMHSVQHGNGFEEKVYRMPSQHASLSTSEKNELEFEVLSDENAVFARQLGLVFTLPEDLGPFARLSASISKLTMARSVRLTISVTFVVDTDGEIAFAMVDADYTLRAEPADILFALDTLAAKSAN